jgi:hypothetical protein
VRYCNVCGNPDAEPDAGHYMLADPPSLCVECALVMAVVPSHLQGPALLARRQEAEPRLRALEKTSRPWSLAGKVPTPEYIEAHRKYNAVVQRLQAMDRLRVRA